MTADKPGIALRRMDVRREFPELSEEELRETVEWKVAEANDWNHTRHLVHTDPAYRALFIEHCLAPFAPMLTKALAGITAAAEKAAVSFAMLRPYLEEMAEEMGDGSRSS